MWKYTYVYFIFAKLYQFLGIFNIGCIGILVYLWADVKWSFLVSPLYIYKYLTIRE